MKVTSSSGLSSAKMQEEQTCVLEMHESRGTHNFRAIYQLIVLY